MGEGVEFLLKVGSNNAPPPRRRQGRPQHYSGMYGGGGVGFFQILDDKGFLLVLSTTVF